MGYCITQDCVLCGECLPVCPVHVISEGSVIYVIDTPRCTECDECLPVCPVNAIVPARGLVPDQAPTATP